MPGSSAAAPRGGVAAGRRPGRPGIVAAALLTSTSIGPSSAVAVSTSRTRSSSTVSVAGDGDGLTTGGPYLGDGVVDSAGEPRLRLLGAGGEDDGRALGGEGARRSPDRCRGWLR